ncbi:tripartite tricarboxylate transporter substrate binding protein [Allopusillimonas ginsengisoli]|nr:tripartite tricarboxylate transporter substrate binding protein [Allopusillimonas ginsengisoli]
MQYARNIYPLRRRWLKVSMAAAVIGMSGMVTSGDVHADEWPTQPVKIVLAIGPGSSGDTLARLLGPKLSEIWKQPVIVENRPGAGGVIGTEHVVNARDGYTLLLGTQSSILPKFTQRNLRFDPLTDLVPVRKVLNYQLVIATNEATARKAGTLKALVALSKESGEGVFFSGTGPTSIFNLSFSILNQQLDMKYSPVDFSNINEMNMAVIRGDTQVVVNNPASLKGYFDNGAVVPLAAISPDRYPNLSEVPTLKEAVGYEGYIPLLWAGFFVPKNTPPSIVDRINRDVETVLADKAFRKQVETTLTGSVPQSSPERFVKEIQEEVDIWKQLFQTINLKQG